MAISMAAPAPAAIPHDHSLSRHQTKHIPIPPCDHRLYVGNIPWDASEDELVEECSIFGRILSFKLVRDKETGKHRGYGFLDFADEESALCAKRNQKGLVLRGRQLKVCDPVRNENKQQKLQSPAAGAAISNSISTSASPPCNPTPIKRPREEFGGDDAVDDSPTSANKRLHILLPQFSAAKPALNIVTTSPHRSDYVEPYSPSASAIPWPWNTNDVHREPCSTTETAASRPHVQQPMPDTRPTTTVDPVDLTGGDVEDTDQKYIDDLLRLAFSICTRHTSSSHNNNLVVDLARS